MSNSAKHRYGQLQAKRSGLETRSERYAELTIPSVCPRDGYDEGTQELNLDYQSVGAQCVNNLVNKMMLALFAPSRPFLRLDLPASTQAALTQALGLSDSQLREQLAIAEKEAMKVLDKSASRPVLYELMAHLAITGNCARYMEDGVMRIFGIKQYVARRNNKGQLVEIITTEKVCVEDLPAEVQVFARQGAKEVCYYRWWKWDEKRQLFFEKQYVEDTLVDIPKYQGQYKRTDMPIQAHCWRLPSGKHYGIGIVEDYVADLEGLSMLSEAEVNGAILASEFRWLVNPGGQTRPEDFKTTRNGDSIPGQKGDVELVVAAEAAAALQIVGGVAEKYIRRLGSAFLMAQSIQRDAERVTAEEIRILANELETTLGGIYSRQAVDLQLPLAYWMLEQVDMDVLGDSELQPTIITGLDALSRNGDLENLQMFMNDCMPFVTMPPEFADYFKLPNIFSDLAAGRGIMASTYLNDQGTVDQLRQTRQQQMMQQQQELMGQEAALKGNK